MFLWIQNKIFFLKLIVLYNIYIVECNKYTNVDRKNLQLASIINDYYQHSTASWQYG